MDPGIKQRWIDALRGGEYNQGKGLLRNSGKFCCLGVLCDLVDPRAWSNNDHGYYWYKYNDQSDEMELPDSLAEKIDLSDNHEQILICMNDDGKSFGEIADYIEKNL